MKNLFLTSKKKVLNFGTLFANVYIIEQKNCPREEHTILKRKRGRCERASVYSSRY